MRRYCSVAQYQVPRPSYVSAFRDSSCLMCLCGEFERKSNRYVCASTSTMEARVREAHMMKYIQIQESFRRPVLRPHVVVLLLCVFVCSYIL